MKAAPVTEEVYKYITDRFNKQDEILDGIIRETETLNIPLIQISPDQGKFLYLATRMMNAKNALEIGTLTGYSGVHIARGLAEGGKLTTVEIIKKHAETAKKYFDKAGLSDKVEVVVSPALDYMKELVSKKAKFDLIFIDADKTSYPAYYEEALKLSRSGTAIILDNLLKAGRVIEDNTEDADLKAVQFTNNLISADKRVDSMLMTIGDGFGLIVVK